MSTPTAVGGTPPAAGPHLWLPDWPTLDWALPIENITPAPYNPRYLSDEAFERLKASIARFGVIKPIIVNKNGTILAGHQRTKAMTAIGLSTTPAVILGRHAGSDDEVQFNLTHNAVEENACTVQVPPCTSPGYRWVHPRDITVTDLGKIGARLGKLSKLIGKHGPWGSAVAAANGTVIANAEYAAAVKVLRMPLLVHYNPADSADVAHVLGGDFGIYDAGKASTTPFAQTMLQRYRLRGIGDGDWRDRDQGSFRSTTWERIILPNLTRDERVLDFGAGRCDYARHLAADGYDVMVYEPFYIHVDEVSRKQDPKAGRRSFDVAAIGHMILDLERRVRTDGLFDRVVLDSVINASSSEAYQDWIFNTVAAFLKPDTGRLCMGTLSTRDLEARNNMSKARSVRATVSYIGEHNRGVAYAHGVIYAVKYHSRQTLTDALAPYFTSIDIEGTGNQLRAVCTGLRPLDPERTFTALVEEFDMSYPGDYRHGAHKGLITALMQVHWPDWTPPAAWPVGGISNGAGRGDNTADELTEAGS